MEEVNTGEEAMMVVMTVTHLKGVLAAGLEEVVTAVASEVAEAIPEMEMEMEMAATMIVESWRDHQATFADAEKMQNRSEPVLTS